MSLSKLRKAYERAVSRNSEAIDRAEQLLKVLILVMPARFGIRSEQTAQAAISVVNLVSLYNRLISLRVSLRESPDGAPLPPPLADVSPAAVVPLACASAVENVALFAEMFASKRGASARWATISAIEAIRAAIQLRLLFLSRGDVVSRHQLISASSVSFASPSSSPSSRSPRAVITYEESRWWERAMRGEAIPITRTFAEIIHILRPLVSRQSIHTHPGLSITFAHLPPQQKILRTVALMKKFGIRSWRVWVGSLAIEISSGLIHKLTTRSLTAAQKSELNRRHMLCLLFLLWSPCFESVFGSSGALWVNSQLRRVPVIRSISKFIAQFVHLYRKYYFNLSFL